MLLKEFVYAARALRKSPGFAVAATLIIALGIGVSTAAFSAANAVLLRPLPYRDPDRLVVAFGELRKRSVTDFPFSNANFIDLRMGSRAAFEDFAGVLTFRAVVPREDHSPEQVRIATVTPNFFRLLGGPVALGRDFVDSDSTPVTQPNRALAVAILSYEYWQRRYGGDRGVLGRTTMNGAQIVGVLRPGFELFFPAQFNVERDPDIWLAGRLAYDAGQRNNVSLRVIGRLKTGATLEAAKAEVDNVAAQIRTIDANHDTAGFHIGLQPMRDYLVAEVQPVILSLMGTAIFLLLIGCANVANLLLVRISVRERERAVRSALGASWWRLVRQMLVESLLLSGMGMLIALGLAAFGTRWLLASAPANLPRLDSVSIDPTVLAFTALAGLAAVAIFGLAPAVRAARPNVMGVLRGAGHTVGLGGSRGLRDAIVITEVALSLLLLTGAGLMFRSFLVLQGIDPGYDSDGILTFLLLDNQGETTPEHRAASTRAIYERLRSIAEVQSVTAASPFPLTGGFFPIRWGTEQALTDATKFQAAELQSVLPGYFETLRTPLIAGRSFTVPDNSPARNVAIVDEQLAAKAFPNQSAVGRRILVRVRSPQPEWVEVIGVVAHQRTTSLADAGREQIYVTDGFSGHGVAVRWAVRTAGDPANLSARIRRELGAFGERIAIAEMEPMSGLVTRAQAKTRFAVVLIGLLASVAALLAAVGLYGVLSTLVRQRTAELGVRMALGAEPASIRALVVGHGLRLGIAGVAIGVVIALLLTRLMNSILVGIKSTDPLTFSAAVALFFAIIVAASWIPARRAAALSAAAALREE
jgi:predicted permease